MSPEEHPRNIHFPGVRHAQVALMFFLLTIGVGTRVQLTVAIVAMTDRTTNSNPDIPTYHWTNKSVILSSFYWGYLTLQILGGVLGKIYGTKYILMGAMVLNSSASLLIPIFADKFGSYGVMACNIFQGAAQGFFYPSVYDLLGRWAPLEEIAKLSNLALAGYAFASIATSPLVGYMCSTSIGWPSSFYLFGCMGYAWTIMWALFGASSPADHKKITREEREYIETSLEVQNEDQQSKVPWVPILTSIPVWALVVASVGFNWGNITLSSEIPTYMNSVMKFDIKSNGLAGSAPSLAMGLSSFIYAPLSDYLISSKILTTGAVRKIFASIAAFGIATPMAILSFLPDNANTLSVVMLGATGIFHGANCGGMAVNQMDLSPKYAGIVMAITNSISMGIGMMSPLLVQFVVTDESDKLQWRTIFLVMAALCVVTNLVFVFFGAFKVQDWDGDERKKRELYDDKERKVCDTS